MPDIHLLYGGSTIKRTMHCPYWVEDVEKYRELVSASSPAAHRGSALHDCMEDIARTGAEPASFEGKAFPKHANYVVDDDDVEALADAWRMAEDVFDRYDVEEMFVENFVQYADDVGGSMDLLGVGPNHVVSVDWKFGHQWVDAYYQNIFYLWCGAHTPHLKEYLASDRQQVAVTIGPAFMAEPMVHEVTESEYREAVQKMLIGIGLGRKGGNLPNPGDHCTFCPKWAWCDARKQQAVNFMEFDPEMVEDLDAAMSMVSDIKAHLKAIEGATYTALRKGAQMEHWKLVEKQSRRRYTDEEAFVKAVGRRLKKADMFDTKLKSPAQIEKVAKKLGAKIPLDDFVTTESNEFTIAPMSDKREAAVGDLVTPERLAAVMPDS